MLYNKKENIMVLNKKKKKPIKKKEVNEMNISPHTIVEQKYIVLSLKSSKKLNEYQWLSNTVRDEVSKKMTLLKLHNKKQQKQNEEKVTIG
jgi:hypothetical protein